MAITLSRAQVRRVDELAIERYRIPGIILMENAARNAADLIRATYGNDGRAVIFAGPGNNGGDGCVIARHLHNAGWTVRFLITATKDRFTPDTRVNFDIIQAMGLAVTIAPTAEPQTAFARSIESGEVVIDALLGTGFRGEVRSPTAELIQAINAAPRCGLVAVDVPSGLDCDTGEPSNATIRADLTITFVANKRGFLQPTAADYVGRVEVADIGAPRELIAEIVASPI